MYHPCVSDISCLGTRNRNKTAKVPNPRESIGTVHLERTRGRRSALSGRVPTGKRPSELRPSGYRRSREREFCALQNRDARFPDRDKGGPQKRSREKRTGGRRNRDSTYRESRGIMLFGIEKSETPTG
jgi:hypothetical protein